MDRQNWKSCTFLHHHYTIVPLQILHSSSSYCRLFFFVLHNQMLNFLKVCSDVGGTRKLGAHDAHSNADILCHRNSLITVALHSE